MRMAAHRAPYRRAATITESCPPAESPAPPRSGRREAVVIVGAGVVAALNYGKLPPALQALQADLGLTLLQSSWLVSLFMISAALIGIAGGSIADYFGARRVMIVGLMLCALSGLLGMLGREPLLIFASRIGESIGFMLAVLPGPALLRATVPAASVRGWLGAWSAYMPAGMSLALVATPWIMGFGGWRAAWASISVVALVWAWLIVRSLPAGLCASASGPAGGRGGVSMVTGVGAILQTLVRQAREASAHRGPWLLCLCFLFYAGQFVGIFSFLPSIYSSAGITPATGATLTALAVLANAPGNLAAGLMLQRGFRRHALIAFAGLAMGAGAWVAFGTEAPFALRYAAVVILSMAGGLIPGTLFATAPFYAPHPAAVSTTVGLMQQGSGLGQMLIPPVIAALAQYHGNWSLTWLATGSAALATVLLAWLIGRHDTARRLQR
jgi:MFS transporter, CP family, cyanate transporter